MMNINFSHYHLLKTGNKLSLKSRLQLRSQLQHIIIVFVIFSSLLIVGSKKKRLGFIILSSFLYINGTSPYKVKKVHGGKSVWIVLARHFKNRVIFTVNSEVILWNNIRYLASGIIIRISLKNPVKSKLGNIFNHSFVMRIAIF